ncbi:MAG: hypothetical protein LBJ24_02525 [Treponema sp.]|jgi:hypothetical protein|nr:hypothetical protein [Treponema sp.]
MADYIPRSDGAFDTFFVFLVQYVTSKCTEGTWTHIPAAARTELASARNGWTTAWTNVKGPHTKVDTEAKNDAKKAAEALIRPFVNQYLRFPPVTNEDRTAMGIVNPDPHRTPVQPPKEGPSYSVAQAGPAALGIVYRDGDKGKRGSKPKGMTGAEIHYGVFDTAPADQEDLPGMVWATKVPHDIHFREADRGKRAWFALKWGSRKEKCESPWSEMQSEVVP